MAFSPRPGKTVVVVNVGASLQGRVAATWMSSNQTAWELSIAAGALVEADLGLTARDIEPTWKRGPGRSFAVRRPDRRGSGLAPPAKRSTSVHAPRFRSGRTAPPSRRCRPTRRDEFEVERRCGRSGQVDRPERAVVVVANASLRFAVRLRPGGRPRRHFRRNRHRSRYPSTPGRRSDRCCSPVVESDRSIDGRTAHIRARAGRHRIGDGDVGQGVRAGCSWR